jgi:hypothetical protein
LAHSIELNHYHFKTVADELLFALHDVTSAATRRGRILVGSSGVGKTRICEYLTSKFPRVKDGRRITVDGSEAVADYIPVIYMTLDIEARKTGFLQGLAEAIGTKTPHKRLEKHVIESLKWCGTRWIILDEAQRLLKVGGQSYRPGLVETIKDIHDNSGACFLLVGNPAAERVLDRDAQIRRRFEDTMYLPAYDWTNDVEASEFCSVCKSLWQAMGVHLDPALEEDIVSFCERLHFVSTGILGELIKLFSKAEQIRRFESKNIVDNDVLYRAVNSAFALHKREYSNKASPDKKDAANPFAPGWQPRKATPYKPDWMG